MKKLSFLLAGALATVAALCPAIDTDACTRVVYHGSDSLFVVARSLDWKTPIPTNIYVYPRGMKKAGSDQANGVTWTSKYGAVYAVGYDGGITEGMNEEGLVVNGLFCKGTVYTNPEKNNQPVISLAMIVGWLLDNCATVEDVVNLLSGQNFQIQGATFDGGTVSTLHWGVTDTTGHSIIFEFDNGELHVHEMGDYYAMTNDPQWPQMTAIMDYWNKIGGKNFLPGTVTSADRCVRANYFAHHVKPVAEQDMAVAIAATILDNSSVPFSYEIEGEPNLSSTQWKSYSDIRDRCYYFDVVTNPGYFYIDLKRLDLRKGAPVLKLDTSKTSDLVGLANHRLFKTEPFKPMY